MSSRTYTVKPHRTLSNAKCHYNCLLADTTMTRHRSLRTRILALQQIYRGFVSDYHELVHPLHYLHCAYDYTSATMAARYLSMASVY
eukprot:5168-Heterococcus_DN1.PRE.7